jgi:hypothetical protein
MSASFIAIPPRLHPIRSLALPQIPLPPWRIGVPFFHTGQHHYDDKESKMLPIIEREKSMLKALEKYNRY